MITYCFYSVGALLLLKCTSQNYIYCLVTLPIIDESEQILSIGGNTLAHIPRDPDAVF